MTTSTTSRKSSWRSADLKSHAGSPITSDADFFMSPPSSIGELISADTTLSAASGNPMPAILRWPIIIVSTVFVTILVLLLFNRIVITIIAGVAVACFTWSSTRFHHTCSYVGSKGAMSYELINSRTGRPKENLLLFADAHSLYTKTTRNYYNGIYTGTDYSYIWHKNSGNQHKISGNYRSENNPPQDRDVWHFANVAESIWSSYLLSTLDDKIAQTGYTEFQIAGAVQSVRVGTGFLEFVSKKEGTQKVFVSDMRDISLAGGIFQFKHQDARWWSGKGKYSFEYASIPNAKVFLICIQKIAGISFS
jgi:hypothetical protein